MRVLRHFSNTLMSSSVQLLDNNNNNINNNQQQQHMQQPSQSSVDTNNNNNNNNNNGGVDAAGMHAVAQTSNAILARLKEVEQNNANMAAMVEKLKAESQSKDNKIKDLSADKRKEMEQMIDTAVEKWLNSLTGVPEEVRQQFKNGICKIAEQADMKNAAWEIVCNASLAHESNVNKINELIKTCSEQGETIKTLMTSSSAIADPSFSSEASRMSTAGSTIINANNKRPRMDLEPQHIATTSADVNHNNNNNNNNNNNDIRLMEGGGNNNGDAWMDFEKMMKQEMTSKYF